MPGILPHVSMSSLKLVPPRKTWRRRLHEWVILIRYAIRRLKHRLALAG